jgi:hypothetical protein
MQRKAGPRHLVHHRVPALRRLPTRAALPRTLGSTNQRLSVPALRTTAKPDILRAVLRTVSETEVFIRYAAEVWSTQEREEFINHIAGNPEAGKIIRGSGGCRKVRWSSQGQGKQGGARVIYFLSTKGTVWLLIVYKKAKFDTLPTEFLVALKQGVEDAL